MQKMLDTIDRAIVTKYEEIRQEGKLCTEIRDLNRQIRADHPGLAEHIKKRMLEIAKENGDLPCL